MTMMPLSIFLGLSLITFFSIGLFFYTCDQAGIKSVTQMQIFFIIQLLIFLLDIRTYSSLLNDRTFLIFVIVTLLIISEVVNYFLREYIAIDLEAEQQDIKLMELVCALYYYNYKVFVESEKVYKTTIRMGDTEITRIETKLFPSQYFEYLEFFWNFIIRSKTYKGLYIGTKSGEKILELSNPNLIGLNYDYIR